MKYEIGGLTAFLKRSVSAFHAAEAICEELRGAGYAQLQESERWAPVPGGKYFVTRNQTSVIAFRVPERGFAPVQAVACHSDSPVFRVKEHAELECQGSYVQLNTERYGGMLMNTWYDRPLSVAGRVRVRTERGIESRLVCVDRDLLLIPHLAIHMNREVNDGVKINPQVDMLPLLGDLSAKGSFNRIIAETAGVAPELLTDGVHRVERADGALQKGGQSAGFVLHNYFLLECLSIIISPFAPLFHGQTLKIHLTGGEGFSIMLVKAICGRQTCAKRRCVTSSAAGSI